MVIRKVTKNGEMHGMKLNLTASEALTIIDALRRMSESDDVHYIDKNHAKSMYEMLTE